MVMISGRFPMTNSPKIRGDKLVLGMLSVIRTLVVELDKSGAIQIGPFIATVDSTADCPPSGLIGQNGWIEQGRVSGSS
jgi:hypothetical protein